MEIFIGIGFLDMLLPVGMLGIIYEVCVLRVLLFPSSIPVINVADVTEV